MDVSAFLKNFKQSREAGTSSLPSGSEAGSTTRPHGRARTEGPLESVFDDAEEDEESVNEESGSDEEGNSQEEENDLAFGMFHSSRKRMRSVTSKYAASGAQHSVSNKEFSPLQILQTNVTRVDPHASVLGFGHVRRRSVISAAALVASQTGKLPVKRSVGAMDAWRSTLLQQKEKLRVPPVREEQGMESTASMEVVSRYQEDSIMIDDLLSGGDAEADLAALLSLDAEPNVAELSTTGQDASTRAEEVTPNENEMPVSAGVAPHENQSDPNPPSPSSPSAPPPPPQESQNVDSSRRGNESNVVLAQAVSSASSAVAPGSSTHKQPVVKKKMSLFARAKEIAKTGDVRSHSYTDNVTVKQL